MRRVFPFGGGFVAAKERMILMNFAGGVPAETSSRTPQAISIGFMMLQFNLPQRAWGA